MFHSCRIISTYLFFEIVFPLQQAFSQNILEFFHKYIFRIEKADKRANDIRIFRFSVLYIRVSKRRNSIHLDLHLDQHRLGQASKTDHPNQVHHHPLLPRLSQLPSCPFPPQVQIERR